MSDEAVPQHGRLVAGDLSIDVDRRRVWRGPADIEMGALTFDFLLVLVRSAPRVVSRAEIKNRVWKGRYVSAETLMQRVKLLRRALADDAKNPRYFSVLRGQGLVFLPVVYSADHFAPGALNWELPLHASSGLTLVGAQLP